MITLANMLVLLLATCKTFSPTLANSVSTMYNPPWKHCIHHVYPESFWKEFASPGYPYGIDRQIHCSWIFHSTYPYRIKLSFHTLNLTGQINSCFSQYVEYWEIATRKSVGKFCGNKRPGDYVSYGGAVRVDLKADSADETHTGFLMKYKRTREDPGYKKTNSFSSIPSPTPSMNAVDENYKQTPENKHITISPKTGGKINFNLMRRQHNQGQRIVSSRNGAQYPASNHKYRSNSIGKNNVYVVDDVTDNSISFQHWIIILIVIGVFLFFLFLGVFGWLCFCKKSKASENRLQPNGRENGYNGNTTEKSFNHKLNSLPGYPTDSCQLNPTNKEYSYQWGIRQGKSRPSVNCEPYCKVVTENLNQKAVFPVNQPNQNKQRKAVPTLKRKFSPWEKQQIKNGKFKM